VIGAASTRIARVSSAKSGIKKGKTVRQDEEDDKYQTYWMVSDNRVGKENNIPHQGMFPIKRSQLVLR
jgi:hypothetical protein